MIIRIRYEQLGGHVHCDVYTAKAKNMTFARVGTLCFAAGEEWDAIRNQLQASVEFVPREGFKFREVPR